MPKLWNLRDKHKVRIPRDAVYVGRGTPWGNPFIGGTHGSRAHVIKRFVEEVLPDLDVSSLRGKDLVCWCHPLPCHGAAIMEKANELPEGLTENADGALMFDCNSCGQEAEWCGEVQDFEEGGPGNYCGRSPSCVP